MSQHDDHPILPPTGIDIPPEIRWYVITLLQHTLACTIDLRSQVKQAGWNVKGHDFAPLHALFATIATALEGYTDLVAERLVVLGGVAQGTVRTATQQSTLAEYPVALMEGDAAVQALVGRFTAYATTIRGDITHTADVEDAGSAAVYTDLSRGVDAQLGRLETYLYRSLGS